MAKKREQHEIKIIIILAILSVIIFGLTFGIRAIQAHQQDATQVYIDNATMTQAPYSLEVTDDTEPFTLTKTDKTWSCENDPEIRVSSLRITMMRTVLKYFQPVRIITDAEDRWSEFGLDHPQRVMTLTSDEKKNTYLIGDYNPILDEYYMVLEGQDDVVFLMSSEDMKDFNLALLGYVNQPEAADLESKDLRAIRVKTPEESFDIDMSSGNYKVDTGSETFEAGQYLVLNILSTFTSNTYRCVGHQVTDAELAQYDLADPEYTVTFTDKDGKEYLMDVSAADDGKYYARENRNGVVYQIEPRTYENLIERTRTETLKG